MSRTVSNLSTFNFGSEYLYQKMLLKILASDGITSANKDVFLDVYNQYQKSLSTSSAYNGAYDTSLYSANNIYSSYYNYYNNDDAVTYESALTQRIDNMVNEYLQDSILPENSTVSYHV